jgi:RHS repeat-associated protein
MSGIRAIALAAAVLAALPAFPDQPETLPPGMEKYIVALWAPGTPVPGDPSRRIPDLPEPDMVKLGGRVLKSEGHRRVVLLPRAAVEQVRRHESVAYLQRVWMGEPLSQWSDVESESFLKAETNDDPPLTCGPAAYAYDGDGNIKSITTPASVDSYVYDNVGRLLSATVKGKTETYKYDGFGNLTYKGLADSQGTYYSVDSASNRLKGREYDVAGNLLTRGERSRYGYDSLNMVVYTPGAQGREGRRILYDASEERIGAVMGTALPATFRWTIRDFQGQVLREYFSTNPYQEWEWQQDHIRGEGQLLAGETIQWKYDPPNASSATGGGKRHYHLDHLGSVRMVSNQAGRSIGEHDYYPFSASRTAIWQEQLYPGNQNNDGMRFAGHWRDYLGYVDAESPDYLDYMHARYYDPQLGRFLSVDPVLAVKRAMHNPQGWNRYSYVQNNPINRIDPAGRLDGNAMGPLDWESGGLDRAEQLAVSNRTAAGTAFLSSLFAPGPEDVPLLLVGATKAFRAAARLFGRGAAVADDIPLALPAPRQVAAGWGVNTYRHGGRMSTIEHINYRHAFNSGFKDVSKFAAGTSVRQIQGYVDDALRHGKVTASGRNSYDRI